MQQVFAFDAGPVVGDGQAPAGQFNFDGAVLRTEFHGIVQEDHQHLVQAAIVAGHFIHRRIQLTGHRDIFIPRQLPGTADGPLYHFTEVQRFFVNGEVHILQPGQIQQVVDEPLEEQSLIVHGVVVPFHVGRLRHHFVPESFQTAPHHRYRRAQLMGNVGDEFFPDLFRLFGFLIGFFQTYRHTVQGGGQFADLVVLLHVTPGRVVAGRQFFRRVFHLVQGFGELHGQEPGSTQRQDQRRYQTPAEDFQRLIEGMPQTEHRHPQHQDAFHASVFVIDGSRGQHHHLVDPLVELFPYGGFPFKSLTEHIPVHLGEFVHGGGAFKDRRDAPSLGSFVMFHMAPDIIGRLFHVAFLDVGPHGDIAILIGHPHVVRRNNIYIGDQPAGTQQAARIDCFGGRFRRCLPLCVLAGKRVVLRSAPGAVSLTGGRLSVSFFICLP